MLYVEPTYMVGGFGVYGKVGLAHVSLNSLESIAFGDDSTTYGDVDLFGSVVGLGVKGYHSSGLFIKIEGTVTDFQTAVLPVTSQGDNRNRVEGDPEARSVRMAFGYNF